MVERVGLTDDSPVVVRMRKAVTELNASESELARGLMNADVDEAVVLADRVAVARTEFDAAYDEFAAALRREAGTDVA